MRLQPWYKVVTPREDLREGRPLDASEFAVHLDQVRSGDAPTDYQNPARFFERTYLTKSLVDLAAETVRRLSGETVETSPVFNLSTQFGGGKTHSLTLLYHLAASGPEALKWQGIRKVLDRAGVSRMPKAETAVFVGTEFDVISGRGGDDGTPKRLTPWGEIAFQLGGPEALKVVREHEKDPITAPSAEVIARFIPQDRPCLILIDELMNYVNRGRSRGLAEQVYSFLQNLSEQARRQRNVVLCVSVPASELEMSAQDQQDFDRLRKLLDRVGKPIAMSAGSETSEIIRRRLFEWDGLPPEARKTCGAYAEWVRDHRSLLPDWFPTDTAAEEFEATYPFHPSLISVFERKWQTLPRFQRTRGVLRLLALWVSITYVRGYKGGHKDALMGTGTAPLDELMFRTAMFEQLGEEKLESAVTTDICGGKEAHAVRLDNDAVDTIRDARLHEKTAISAFLESNGGQTSDYATEPEIRLSVGAPGVDIGNVETVLGALATGCYYFRAQDKRYWFSLRANLNKILADKRAAIEEKRIDELVREEIQKVFKAGPDITRVFCPEQSSHIPDRPALTLVTVSPEMPASDPATKRQLREWTMQHGASARTFKNAVIWCVAEGEDALRSAARELLAWEDISQERDRHRLDDTDASQLRQSLHRAEKELTEAVWRTYNRVLLLRRDNELHTVDLGLLNSSAGATLAGLIIGRLKEQDDVTDTMSPTRLTREDAWPPVFAETGWPTKAVRDAIYASPRFSRLLDPDAVRKTIADGVEQGLFAYVGLGEPGRLEPFLYKEPMSPADVEISDAMAILPKAAAEAYAAGVEAPPLPRPPVTEPDDGDRPTPPEPAPEPDKPTGTGAKRYPSVRWQGDVPWQKWSNFYMKVLSRHAQGGDLRLTVSFELRPPDGLEERTVDEMRAALRELGLEDGVEAE